ncbi:MAG: cobalamin-binding protein [Deltaproteobacteria bacterium]|nr:cobalamin-binding protein [Deltaproteobacteria bacterium]
MRIASLLPSATEIVCALGFRDALVGRSHECDYPLGVETLPSCAAARIDASAASREIDDQVRSRVRDALSIYDVNTEQLRMLRPDLIVTQDQCEVCAVSLGDVEQALAGWTGVAPRVVSLSPCTLADVWSDLGRVGDALGAQERARALCESLTERVTEIGERAGGRATRPRVAGIEWIEPLMGAGNWVPELVALAGGESLLGKPGEHSPWIRFDALAAADPDVIAVLPCGFDLARTRAELGPLLEQPGWGELRAVREERVFLLEGNQYFNRPGPRLVESLEILAEILHPAAFDFGHQGTGWERL